MACFISEFSSVISRAVHIFAVLVTPWGQLLAFGLILLKYGCTQVSLRRKRFVRCVLCHTPKALYRICSRLVTVRCLFVPYPERYLSFLPPNLLLRYRILCVRNTRSNQSKEVVYNTFTPQNNRCSLVMMALASLANFRLVTQRSYPASRAIVLECF